MRIASITSTTNLTILFSIFFNAICCVATATTDPHDGLERHFLQIPKANGIRRVKREISQDNQNNTFMSLSVTENQHQRNKRSYQGQGTYFYPGQGTLPFVPGSVEVEV